HAVMRRRLERELRQGRPLWQRELFVAEVIRCLVIWRRFLVAHISPRSRSEQERCHIPSSINPTRVRRIRPVIGQLIEKCGGYGGRLFSNHSVNVILLEPEEVNPEGEVTLTGPRARHVRDVLKPGPGQMVRVGMLNGSLGSAAVTLSADRGVSLRCTFTSERPSRPRVDLLLAVPRPKVLRRLWAQLAALGVGQIILTNAERVERNYFDTHVLTEACYRPLLIEGLQQARDTWLPRVSIHKQFRILIEDHLTALFPRGHRLVAHPGSLTTDMRLAGIGS